MCKQQPCVYVCCPCQNRLDSLRVSGCHVCRVTEHLAATSNVALAGISSVRIDDLAKALMALRMAAFADPGEWGIQALFPIAPVVDGDILPHAPLDPIAGTISDIDILVGYTKDEAAFIVELLPWLKADPKLFPSMIGFPQVCCLTGQLEASSGTIAYGLLQSLLLLPCCRRLRHEHSSVLISQAG